MKRNKRGLHQQTIPLKEKKNEDEELKDGLQEPKSTEICVTTKGWTKNMEEKCFI